MRYYLLLSLGYVRTTYAANFRSILCIKLLPLLGSLVGQRLGTFARQRRTVEILEISRLRVETCDEYR